MGKASPLTGPKPEGGGPSAAQLLAACPVYRCVVSCLGAWRPCGSRAVTLLYVTCNSSHESQTMEVGPVGAGHCGCRIYQSQAL